MYREQDTRWKSTRILGIEKYFFVTKYKTTWRDMSNLSIILINTLQTFIGTKHEDHTKAYIFFKWFLHMNNPGLNHTIYKSCWLAAAPLSECILKVDENLTEVRGAVVAQWIRPQTLNRGVPGSNLPAAAVVPLGKALYPHCLVPRKGLKAVGPLVACL